MAGWNDFFGNNNNNRTYEWILVGTESSPLIEDIPPEHESNYKIHTTYSEADPDEEPVTTMELKVPICCEGCQERVLSHLIDIDGVQSVNCDQSQQKVTVVGTTPPEEILKACKKLFKRSSWWPTP